MHELVYRTHAPKVLRELCGRFKAFIESNPGNHPMVFDIKTMILVAESVAR